MTNARTRQAGLTLLELMVAMGIFSVVGTAIYSTFATAIQTRDYATERAHRYADVRLALDRIEQDLRGSYDAGLRGTSVPPRMRAPLPENAPLGDDRMVLEMTTISARGVLAPESYVEDSAMAEIARMTSDRGDQAHVRWVLDEDGVLLRYELKPVRAEEVDWTIAPYEIIARDVDIELEFYDQTQWLEFWDTTQAGTQQGRVPTLVRTRLETVDPDETPIVLVSSVIIPMAVEAAIQGRPTLAAAMGKKTENNKDDKNDAKDEDDNDGE